MDKVAHSTTVNGINCHYKTAGVGEPLLMLHGWTLSSTFWNDYIEPFATHFKVYLIDLYGHGKSDPLAKPFEMQDAADHLIALLDHLSLNAVKAIGFSYGAEMLLRIASDHPERISAMMLIGASHQFPKQDWSNLLGQIDEETMDHLVSMHAGGETQLYTLFDELSNYESLVSKEALSRIQASVLVTFGEKDHTMDLETALDLHHSLSKSSLWVVPNSFHFPFARMFKDEFASVGLKFFSDEWDNQSA